MSQLLMNKLRGLAGFAALLVVFLVVCTVDANAQVSVNPTRKNPLSAYAEQLGVNACPMGTATNVQGGLAALKTQRDALRSSLGADLANASAANKFKYFYFSYVVAQVESFSVAPEIALLKGLTAASKSLPAGSITPQAMKNMYNSTKALFGMC